MNTTQDQPAAAQRNGDPLDRAFAWLRSLGIMRDPSDRWIGGVCSGVAHRLGVDPVIVRIALIVLTVMGGIGLPAYLLGWSLLPDTNGEIKAESGIRHGDGTGIALLVVTGLSLGSVFTFGDQGWRFGWIIPAGLLAFWISRRHGGHGGHGHQWHRGGSVGSNAGTAVPPRPTWADGGASDGSTGGSTSGSTEPQSYWTQVGEGGPVGYDTTSPVPAPTPAPPAKPKKKGRRSMGIRGALVTFGLAIAAYGLGRVLDGPIGFPGTADVLGRILALGVIALAIIVAALRGRTSGFPGFVGVVLALTTAGAIANPSWGDFEGNFGDRVLQPTNAQGDLRIGGGLGDTTIDLSALSPEPPSAPTIRLDGGAGDVTIQVPKDLTVQLDAQPRLGEVTDGDGDHIPSNKLIGPAGPADVTVRIDGGLGDIIVKEMP